MNHLLIVARDLSDAIHPHAPIECCQELGIKICSDAWCHLSTRPFFENLKCVEIAASAAYRNLERSGFFQSANRRVNQ